MPDQDPLLEHRRLLFATAYRMLGTVTDVEDTALADTVSTAMLVVLETLAPVERAVFLLREVFGYSHAEIADTLDRSEASVRQIAHRARDHVRSRRPRYDTDRAPRARSTDRFMAACAGGDLAALMDLPARMPPAGPTAAGWSLRPAGPSTAPTYSAQAVRMGENDRRVRPGTRRRSTGRRAQAARRDPVRRSGGPAHRGGRGLRQ
ncbi:sigma factor-like helix-turn-helix DNA-binding protein [Nocardia sp. SSK8]|uniref:sigma factor-like helix-turn-helix DNA-binding protein n=1 Tax=Nocardia sp. SSK8 TaxID=3120154 RepID=UPI003FA58DDB